MPQPEQDSSDAREVRDAREDRERQILEAAMAVFAREGFHEARMEDIARQSGLGKGTLYLYYKSKDAIIGALLRTFFNVELRALQALEGGEGSIAERLLDYTRRLAVDAERMAVFAPIAYEFYAVAGRDKGVRSSLKEYFATYHEVAARLIQRGMDAGEFRRMDAGEIATTFIGLLEGLNLLSIIDSGAFSMRAQAESAVRLLLEALKAG